MEASRRDMSSSGLNFFMGVFTDRGTMNSAGSRLLSETVESRPRNSLQRFKTIAGRRPEWTWQEVSGTETLGNFTSSGGVYEKGRRHDYRPAAGIVSHSDGLF